MIDEIRKVKMSGRVGERIVAYVRPYLIYGKTN